MCLHLTISQMQIIERKQKDTWQKIAVDSDFTQG